MSSYLFRIDGAKDNDAFFDATRQSASLVYAGLEFQVGTGWVPDFVRVTLAEPPGRCSLTLIELEATERAAKNSSRKYLAESSAEIVNAFTAYLDRVIRQCRSSADARESGFVRLQTLLSEANDLMITTAAALRSSTDFVEERPLIDRPGLAVVSGHARREPQEDTKPTFHGDLRLSQRDSQALGRCVAILDAVLRQCPHSSAKFLSWRVKSPLKQLLSEDRRGHPELRRLIFRAQNRGVNLDFEKVLSELSELWSAARSTQPDGEQIRALISSYYPLASEIKQHVRMATVLDSCRKHVLDQGL